MSIKSMIERVGKASKKIASGDPRDVFDQLLHLEIALREEQRMDQIVVYHDNGDETKSPLIIIRVELLGRSVKSLLDWYAKAYDFDRELLTAHRFSPQQVEAPIGFDEPDQT